MKVLIGVCGIGKGHCTRQLEISRELIKRGHQVRIITYNEGIDFFQKTNIKFYDVYVPIIIFKGDKINWLDYIKRNFQAFIPGKIKNYKVFNELKKEDFLPDLCISDYEPNVANISYKLGKPLINIDQQSKYIYMKEDNINGFSCIEEKKRLGLFFPKCDKKYIISFYKIDEKLLPSNVEIFSPIIRNDLKEFVVEQKEKIVVVYFSKYINIPIKQKYEEIIDVFKKFKNYNFLIFSDEISNNLENPENNIIIKKNDRNEFIKALGKATCAISTAGHTLISETLYCKIPIYTIPLPTFDQMYCGKFINDNDIGYSSDRISYEKLKSFFSNIEIYKKNIRECQNFVKPLNTVEKIVDGLEKMYENNN